MPIYLDYNATTPVDPRVLEAMLPYFSVEFGNASSVDHLHGATASVAVDDARERIAKTIGARVEEIVFTSGATESNNLAIIGAALSEKARGKHVIVSCIEHPAVLEAADYLSGLGFEITRIPVDHAGLVSPDSIVSALRQDTVLVSVMAANNEIGTIQRIREIGAVVKAHGATFHTDAAQAIAHVPIDVDDDNVDLLSISGHKIYGPKGIGVLYVRRRNPRVNLRPLTHGGGHERGLRSGTLNVPAIIGMAKALDIAKAERKREVARLSKQRDSLLENVRRSFPGLIVNGSMERRLPGNLNVLLPGIENRALIQLVSPVISISAGSACTTTEVTPSHVLLAIGRSELEAHHSFRASIGRYTSDKDVAQAGAEIAAAVQRLQKMHA